MKRSTNRLAWVLLVAGMLIGALVVPASAGALAGAPLIDPGDLGPQSVDDLSYDLGDQAFQPVGFPSKVELKAKVYAPTTISGRAPLVILQHGRHATCATAAKQLLEWPCPIDVPEIPSYAGYDALGRNLASHGMVVVSVGANGVNADDGFLADGGASARAQLILEHLRRWRAWDASAAGSPFGARFVGHIDLADVGLMGHSRGGEGIAAAVQLNQRTASPFGIKAALALAPVDFGRRVIGGVNLGVILPYCDGDVSDLQGASYFDDGRYASPGDPSAKLTALLYGANHNFFNTVWTTGPGSGDDADFQPSIDSTKATGSVDPCRAGGVSRLTAPQQEQAGATLMAGFFRRYLDPEPGLQRFVTGTAPFPASSGAARWSIAYQGPDRLDVESWATPDTYRVNAFGQLTSVDAAATGLVCNAYGRDGDLGGPRPAGVSTTPCPFSEGSAATNDTGVLDVGWVRQGAVVRQPLGAAGVDVRGFDGLRMRVAVVNDSRNSTRAKQDFTVVLEDADGARASVAASAGSNSLARINPGLVQHAVLNGVRVPLASFATVDLSRIRAVELRFDRTGAGRLSIADLAFTQEGTGAAPANTVGPTAITPSQPLCRRSNANRWACALVQAAYGRDPYQEEIAPLARGYATAEGRKRAITSVVLHPEATDLVARQFVEPYIQADIDAEWLDSVLTPAGRRTWEGAIADLTAGFAFAGATQTSSAKVVDAAYQTLLGRRADPAGLAHWTPKVDGGTLGPLASALLRTETHRRRVVDERYLQLVGRLPDPSGRTYWVGRLATPGGEQALVASLLATESFRVAATH